MSYIQENLIPGEVVQYEAKVSKLTLLPGAVLAACGIALAATQDTSPMAPIIVGLGAYMMIKGYVAIRSTELAVTNKRVMAKWGLIRRSTIELQHNKVESLNVAQGLLDRLLNTGTVVVNGSGGSSAPLRQIDNPTALKKAVHSAIDVK